MLLSGADAPSAGVLAGIHAALDAAHRRRSPADRGHRRAATADAAGEPGALV
ncbi:hypothetical protein [Xylophilus ampelinus]|uniref:hypothetical protein n=1 Tax=Xylophilus ampelinus TaxID=54067 RepID=UPI001314B240|nr:hypothetical protein [Xylophilus ampelinus]MCS4509254.1 hypothetical protein [Xylophilus ampelinus]